MKNVELGPKIPDSTKGLKDNVPRYRGWSAGIVVLSAVLSACAGSRPDVRHPLASIPDEAPVVMKIETFPDATTEKLMAWFGGHELAVELRPEAKREAERRFLIIEGHFRALKKAENAPSSSPIDSYSELNPEEKKFFRAVENLDEQGIGRVTRAVLSRSSKYELWASNYNSDKYIGQPGARDREELAAAMDGSMYRAYQRGVFERIYMDDDAGGQEKELLDIWIRIGQPKIRFISGAPKNKIEEASKRDDFDPNPYVLGQFYDSQTNILYVNASFGRNIGIDTFIRLDREQEVEKYLKSKNKLKK